MAVMGSKQAQVSIRAGLGDIPSILSHMTTGGNDRARGFLNLIIVLVAAAAAAYVVFLWLN